LLETIEDIGEHLEYFKELEKATRMLNHPGESLIFEPDFLYMVERVDVCISFLKTHVSSLVLIAAKILTNYDRGTIAKPTSIFSDFSNA
jgi:hypothetical protein